MSSQEALVMIDKYTVCCSFTLTLRIRSCVFAIGTDLGGAGDLLKIWVIHFFVVEVMLGKVFWV